MIRVCAIVPAGRVRDVASATWRDQPGVSFFQSATKPSSLRSEVHTSNTLSKPEQHRQPVSHHLGLPTSPPAALLLPRTMARPAATGLLALVAAALLLASPATAARALRQ